MTQTTTPPQQTEPGDTGGWTVHDSADLYGIDRWGGGYFDIGPNGQMRVRPRGADGPSIDLGEVVEGLRERDLCAPVLLRFNDITEHRMSALRDAFDAAFGQGTGDRVEVVCGDGMILELRLNLRGTVVAGETALADLLRAAPPRRRRCCRRPPRARRLRRSPST